MATIKVVDIRELPAGAADRIGKFDKIVTYAVDPTHVYIVTLPAETFTEQKMIERIRADMGEKEKLVGKEHTI